MSNRLASRDEAQQLLSPHFEDIASIIRQGWQHYRDLPPETVVEWNATTRANVVYDGIKAQCRRVFGGRGADGITLSEKNNFILVNFQNRAILRFKHLDRRTLLSSGHPTAQRLRYMFQQPFLPGSVNPTNLIAGYTVDQLGQEIAGIYITCPRGLRNDYWRIPVPYGDLASEATVAALTLPSGPFKIVQVRSATADASDEKEV